MDRGSEVVHMISSKRASVVLVFAELSTAMGGRKVYPTNTILTPDYIRGGLAVYRRTPEITLDRE